MFIVAVCKAASEYLHVAVSSNIQSAGIESLKSQSLIKENKIKKKYGEELNLCKLIH